KLISLLAYSFFSVIFASLEANPKNIITENIYLKRSHELSLKKSLFKTDILSSGAGGNYSHLAENGKLESEVRVSHKSMRNDLHLQISNECDDAEIALFTDTDMELGSVHHTDDSTVQCGILLKQANAFRYYPSTFYYDGMILNPQRTRAFLCGMNFAGVFDLSQKKEIWRVDLRNIERKLYPARAEEFYLGGLTPKLISFSDKYATLTDDRRVGTYTVIFSGDGKEKIQLPGYAILSADNKFLIQVTKIAKNLTEEILEINLYSTTDNFGLVWSRSLHINPETLEYLNLGGGIEIELVDSSLERIAVGVKWINDGTFDVDNIQKKGEFKRLKGNKRAKSLIILLDFSGNLVGHVGLDEGLSGSGISFLGNRSVIWTNSSKGFVVSTSRGKRIFE
ncbi:MAG TPA: hypothetical protein VHQ04_12880, partial [Puia sp.]|nr:hypothetical protein [Puia sp.]